jgi:hypothetical protein
MPLQLHFLTQTLTTLLLTDNRIGVKGAEHIAHACENNTVTLLRSSSLLFAFSLSHLDTYHT